MPYTPKTWLNYPGTTTPINATALSALENRVAAYSSDDLTGIGVWDWADFLVKQRGAGANMSVDVGLPSTLHQIFIADALGGVYKYEYNGVQLNSTIAVADPTNPRIDRVIAGPPSSVDSIVPVISVLTGTPTGGATLDNLSGAQSVPVGRVLLADVVVGAAVATIVTANIRDRRPFPSPGAIPQPFTATNRDEVWLVPGPGLLTSVTALVPGTHDTLQSAALMFLPRRITGATRMRMRYAQGATPAVTNFNLGINDASGRILASIGPTAFAGGANTIQEVAGVITATSFEAGWYWVEFGVAALTAASAVAYQGLAGTQGASVPGPTFRNSFVRVGTGSTTFPASNTILGGADVVAGTAAQTNLPVPLVSLSVG